MKCLLTIILSFSLISSSIACSKSVTMLNKDQKAPCEGFLFSIKKEQEVRIKLQELGIKDKMITIYKKDSIALEEIADKQHKKSELWRKAAEDSTERMMRMERHQGKRDIMFLLLGIGLTIGAAYGLRQASKK